jgi:murein L,D-transpeptidase YafK
VKPAAHHMALTRFVLAGVVIWASALGAHAHTVNRHLTQKPVTDHSPDAELAAIFASVDRAQIDEALARTDKLILAYPKFRLAYLIRGDLLLAHVAPLTTIGNATNAPPERLEDLRAEAIARLHGYRDKPAANMVPRYLLQLPPDEKTAVVVDVKRSRLYVYENVDGHPRFLADYYITQGKLGSEKLREGDQKTPIGVYHITGRVSRHKLADIYGAGALPINYPNEWDRLNGRTGHGIWLHGTPSNTYSRPPWASDGCVVLANQDLRSLEHSVQIGSTPVIISEDIEWLKLDDWNAERANLQHAIEGWRADWESRDVSHYLSHYSKRFASDSEALRQWSERKRQVNAAKDWVDVTLKNMSMLRYPGADEMVVVTFDQNYRSNNMSTSVKKRQYWVREGGNWKILYEGVA